MQAITKFDKATARKVGEAMLKVLQVEAAKFGLKVEPDRGTYSAGEFNPKFKFTPIALAEGVHTQEQEALLQLAHFDGFNAELLLKPETILLDRVGGHFRVVGYRPRSRKMPYIIQFVGSADRKICDDNFVRGGLQRAGLPAGEAPSGLTLTDPPSRG